MNQLTRLPRLFSLLFSVLLCLLLYGVLLFGAPPQSMQAQDEAPPAPLDHPGMAPIQSVDVADAKPALSQGAPLTVPLIVAQQERQSTSLEGPLAVNAPPVLTIWYGSAQSFGHLGNPQRWVNILGNVANPGSISALIYSLNGAAPQPLSMGADKRRLAEDGDFNVELALADLLDGANTVVVTATNTSNETSTASVTLNYTKGTVWPLPYTTDWANASSIQEDAQIIDGQWAREGATIRPTWLDYDRLVGIGDLSWTDYEVVVPVTLHSVDADDGFKSPSNGPGIGLLLRWQGHFQQLNEQPRTGWQELGALGWFRWSRDADKNIYAGLQLLGYYAGKELAVDPTTVPAFETPYLMKMSVQTTATGDLYRFKLWEQSEPEPAAWNMVGKGNPGGPSGGSVLLVSHHIDASFGNVAVRSLASIRSTLTTNVVGSGQIRIDPQQADYAYGQVVTVTAVPDSGFMLSGWSGDLQGQSNPVALEITKDLVITATFASATAPHSDDFNRCTLSSNGASNTAAWSWIDPRGDGAVQVNGQQAVITVPGGSDHDAWTGGNFAPRLMQSAVNGNLDLVAKFDSVPKSRFQIQGIFIEQDAANYLRFDLYHDGTSLKLHAATILNGTAANVYEAPIAAPNSGPLYLRVARSGDQWTQAYSTDGAGWSTGANFTQPLIVTNVGPFAGNAGSNAPAFTGIVDYFFNSAAPILPEDSNIVGPNLTLTGNGTVTRAPVQSNYYCGQTVTLSAAPATGWRFAGWSGALTGIQNPTALTATVSQAITATFVKESYLLRLDTIGEGQVAVQPIMVAYPFNTIVTVTATPKADWVFAGWEGDHEGSTNPIQITMDRAKAITAIFTTKMVTASYTVSTVVSGEGTLTRSPDAPSYTGGATVTLTATAASGWLFDGWQGLAGTSNPATIIVTRNRVITATFIPLRHVITTAVVGNGAVTRAPDAADYPHGTIVTVTANAAPGWRFAGWQGDGTGIEPSLTLTVDQDLHLTATFVEALPDSYTLLTNVGEGGAITLSPALASYPAGATVTITAVPTTGWVFTGWSGDLTSLENPLTVTMDRAYAIQATFAPMMVTFTATVEGGGLIASSVPPGLYPYGTTVSLVASPAPDNIFLGWGGDLQGDKMNATLKLDGDKAVIARFGPTRHALDLQTVGQGTVSAEGESPYQHNQVVTVTATPAEGWIFTGWSGDAQGQTNPITITVDRDKAVVANFVVEVSGAGTYSLYLPLVAR